MRGSMTGYVRMNWHAGGFVAADRDIIGHLLVDADFSAGTVTTFAGNFRQFRRSGDQPVIGGWNDRGRIYGTLSGGGTISRTTIASKLQGILDDGGDRNVVVNVGMSGQVYDNDGATLVHGDVTGQYDLTKRNRRTGDSRGPGRYIENVSGEFFATAKRNGRGPGLALVADRGPRVKATIDLSRDRYLRQIGNFALIDAAVESGRLEAPRSLPAGRGILTGYMRTDYFASSEDDILPATRNYLVGRLLVGANFDDGTVRTFAGNFREFVAGNPRDQLTSLDISQSGLDTNSDHWQQYVWSGRGEAKNGWNGRGRIYGTLSGDGTITATGIASTLDGKLSDGRVGDITVDANMAGGVYSNGNKILVHGDVTGTYTPATENSLRGKKKASGRTNVRIANGAAPAPLTLGDGDGEFFAIQNYDVLRILNGLKIPSGTGSTIRPLAHIRQIDNMGFIDAAVEHGHLEVPVALPEGEGTLTGYVKADNAFSDRRVIGNLTIDADFGAGTVTTSAQNFRDPRGDVSGGFLTGTGTITATEINSGLNGKIFLGALGDPDRRSTTVDGTMAGNVYDHAGSLLVHGDLTGNFREGPRRGPDIEGGAFYAIQNDPQN